ncbi:hypothetical protein BH18ACT13_BH18ACT13_16390 [soil metagenome]
MRILVVLGVLALVVPASAFAKGKVFFEDTVPSGRSSSITFDTRQTASFRVVLRVPTQARARLFVTGGLPREAGR